MTDVRLTQLVADTADRARQGAIYRDIFFIDGVDIDERDVTVHRVLFPHVCVLSQDCDLETDNLNRSAAVEGPLDGALLSVLVAPMYTAAHVVLGAHLDRLTVPINPSRGGTAFTCRPFVKKSGKPGDHWTNFVMRNRDVRYHYMEFAQDWNLVPKVIDFKHYFSVSVDGLTTKYSRQYLGRLDDLERVHLSQRFASFLSRVGLPDLALQEAVSEQEL